MNKNLQILSGVLVAQLAIAAFVMTKEDSTATFKSTEALFAVDLEKADRIVLEEHEDKQEAKTVEIVKKDGVWVLPGYFNFPASKAKMTEVFNGLAAVKKQWPVGKTTLAAKQFKVADDDFVRRVTFYNGETATSALYLGSSPSFKKVHARKGAEEFTYSIDFNSMDLPANGKDWLNKDELDLERSKVKKLTLNSFSLSNEGGDFKLDTVPEGKESDTAKIADLTTKLLKPRFEDVLGLKSEVALSKESLFQYEVALDNDEQIVYTFFKREDAVPQGAVKDAPHEETIVMTASNSPYAYRVFSYSLDELRKVKAEDLVKAAEPKAESSALTPGSTGKNETKEHEGAEKAG